MRFEHLALSLALVWVPTTSAAQRAPAATAEGLGRFREALAHLQDQDADLGYAVSDDEVARIDQEIERTLRIPATWHVRLRNVGQLGGDMNRSRMRFDAGRDMLWTTLVDPADRQIELHITLDAQWVFIGSAFFMGPDGQTDFTRAQYRERTGFFPLRSIPIVLDRLESELDALPLGKSSVKYLGLESGQSLGESPSVRCTFGIEEESAGKHVELSLNGVVSLPATAAHERDFQFAGAVGTGDSVIGPIFSTKSLGLCFREARALSNTVIASGDWSAHVYHNNGRDSFLTLVHDPRNLRTKREEEDFSIASSGFAGDTQEISASVAGVPLSAAGLSAFLKSLSAAYDPKQSDIFVVIGCADRREIDVVFTSGVAPPPIKADVPALRVVFDAAGTKIEHQDRVLMDWIVHRDDRPYTFWTCQFSDGHRARIRIRHAEMCGNGIDFTSLCDVDGVAFSVAGGITETTLRGR